MSVCNLPWSSGGSHLLFGSSSSLALCTAILICCNFPLVMFCLFLLYGLSSMIPFCSILFLQVLWIVVLVDKSTYFCSKNVLNSFFHFFLFWVLPTCSPSMFLNDFIILLKGTISS